MKAKRMRRGSRAARSPRTSFQLELIRLIEAHAADLGATSGRSLSARLGKSSNHLWQILNRGMVPSGPAVLDIANLLGLAPAETERLILAAIETKGATRSRDRFWITKVREMVSRRDAEILAAATFLRERGLSQDFSVWNKTSGRERRKKIASARPG
jgi:hypothetical protein